MGPTSFKDRFELLLDSGQVSRPAINLTEDVIRNIEKKYGRPLTEDNAAMFVTHTVMAFERLLRGEQLHEVPQEVVDEAAQYGEIREFTADLVNRTLAPYHVQAPDTEISYLALHLAAIQQVDE